MNRNFQFTKFLLRNFFGTLLALAGIAAFAVFFGKGAVVELGLCTSSETICNIWKGLVLTFLLALILFIVFFLIAFFVDSLKEKFDIIQSKKAYKRTYDQEQLRLAQVQAKLMTISVEPLQANNNKLNLRIHNNESFPIALDHVSIGHKDGLQEKQEPTWSRVSLHPFSIDAGESRTFSFLTEREKHHTFVILGYREDGTTNEVIYGLGIHKFEIRIVYDSKEKRETGVIEWFSVILNYKAPGDFSIDIKRVNLERI